MNKDSRVLEASWAESTLSITDLDRALESRTVSRMMLLFGSMQADASGMRRRRATFPHGFVGKGKFWRRPRKIEYEMLANHTFVPLSLYGQFSPGHSPLFHWGRAY